MNAAMERRLGAVSFQSFNNSNLRQRVLSALIMAPAMLWAVYLGGWVYPCVVTLIVTLGFREWLRLVDPSIHKPVALFAYISLILTMVAGAWLTAAFGAMLGTVLVLILFLLAVRDHDERAVWIALGLPYLAGSGLALLFLRDHPLNGMGLTYYLLFVVWATDSGAYVAGRLIGGPKLAPDISPSKTWAGLFGGMALAAVFGYAVAVLFGARHPCVGFCVSICLAVVSQLGDLFESHMKRRSGVKESGDLIPGHGGVLDRIDGLVFAAIFFVLFQVAAGLPMQWW